MLDFNAAVAFEVLLGASVWAIRDESQRAIYERQEVQQVSDAGQMSKTRLGL